MRRRLPPAQSREALAAALEAFYEEIAYPEKLSEIDAICEHIARKPAAQQLRIGHGFAQKYENDRPSRAVRDTR